MIVQIALGIVLAVLILLLLFKLWGVVSAWKNLRIILIAATILAIPIAATSDSPYDGVAGVFILVGLIALGLFALQASPPWLIKLLESLFWLLCTVLFTSSLFSGYSTEQNSVLWAVVAFLVVSVFMLLRSLASVKALLMDR